MEKVCVLITTYNLEEYISEAIESVLNQNVNFDYKIIIGDDCSTDNTIRIIEEYQRKYPKIIELIKSDVNRGSLWNSTRLYSMIHTDYFAFLDGDDKWIDNNGLQKKIDFLEKNRDCVMCGGNTIYLKGGKTESLVINTNKTGKEYSFADYLQGVSPFVHTSSIVYRNIVFSNEILNMYRNAVGTFEESAYRGEDFRFLLHLEMGKIMVLPDVHSIYRIHSQGMWQGASKTKQLLENAISQNFYRKYWKNYNDIFEKRFVASYRRLMAHLLQEKNIDTECNLSGSEAFLLKSLIGDISGDEIEWWKYEAPPKRSLLKKILRR